MKRFGTVALLLVVLAIPASADEFSAVVNNIESHYGFRRTNPHLIGFALILAKPGMWSGNDDRFKFASFENENGTIKPSLQELEHIVLASLSATWQPILRIDSRRDGKGTVIYTNYSDKHMRVFIASIELNSIGVVQMEVDDKLIKRWLAKPQGETETAAHNQ